MTCFATIAKNFFHYSPQDRYFGAFAYPPSKGGNRQLLKIILDVL